MPDAAPRPPPFAGFPAGARAVPVPAAMFTAVFPAIDDAADLAVTLYATAAVQALRRFPRVLDVGALRSSRPLVETLARLLPHDDLDAAFHRGLDAAVARGTLLRLDAPPPTDGRPGGPRCYVTLNTAADRRAVDRVRRGELAPPPPAASEGGAGAAAAWPRQPAPPPGAARAVALYEETIGPITPRIAEELEEAEALYPAAWFADAFHEAAALNKRSWRYVARILERWQAEGRDDAASRRYPRWRPDSPYEHLIRR